MATRNTKVEWIKGVMLLIFFALLFGIPNSSPWFGLVFVYLMAAGLFIVGSMLWIALRSRRAALVLSLSLIHI